MFGICSWDWIFSYVKDISDLMFQDTNIKHLGDCFSAIANKIIFSCFRKRDSYIPTSLKLIQNYSIFVMYLFRRYSIINHEFKTVVKCPKYDVKHQPIFQWNSSILFVSHPIENISRRRRHHCRWMEYKIK